MHQELIDFLAGFPEIDPVDLPAIAEVIPSQVMKKGTMPMREGRVPHACYYVLKGCMREFRLIDGEEKTTAFYTERNPTVASKHFVEQSSSTFSLECMEECLVIFGTRDIEAANFQRFPILQAITAKMVEAQWNESKEAFVRFVTASPEQRYLQFLEREGDLFNRVPQHMIASYLGMKPESLSRIRSRVLRKA
jgi:CRP-like cAMP-binding protein